MFVCCLQVRGGVYLAYGKDLLSGHGGALEEPSTGGRDTKHGCQFIASQGRDVRQLQAKDAPLYIG